MNDDRALLCEFLNYGSETAFSELVRRHIDLVYSVALRQVARDRQLAADATQAVFCELARNAAKLRDIPCLSGWLYNTSRFIASRLYRGEVRRAAREVKFAMTQPEATLPPVGWTELEPILDEAMQALSQADRDAVILRYFRNEPFHSIGASLGLTENAARMRVERALDRLRAILARRRIDCPSTLLGSLLAAHAISAAPASLAAALLAPALASGTAGAFGLGHAFNLVTLMNTSKTAAATAILILGTTATGWILTHRQAGRLKAELAQLRQDAAIAAESAATNALPQTEPAELERLRAGHAELMRLRAEVTQLRQEQRERAAKPPASPSRQPQSPDRSPLPPEKLQALGMAKLTVANAWGAAFLNFAQQNNGQMPADFETAAAYLPKIPDDALQSQEVSHNNFEITYQGSLHDIANPSQAIILREKEPFNWQPDGAAMRTYLFADGHTEIYRSATGDFEPWEKIRQPLLKDSASGQ